MGSPVVNEEFAVEVEAIAAIGAGAEAVVAVDGRNEFAGPAGGKIFCGDVGGGGGVVPFEIELEIDAGSDGRSGKTDVGEKFGGEAGARSVSLWLGFLRG